MSRILSFGRNLLRFGSKPQPIPGAPIPSSSESAERGLGLRNALILASFTATLLAWQLGSARTITVHEGYVVEGAREMLTTGDWLVPRIGGEPWLEKPPLAHWFVSTSMWLFDDTGEFAARLPSALCGLIGVLIFASLIARYCGPTTGLLAGLIQATTISFVTYARLAEADIYLWVLVIGALAVFTRNQIEPVGQLRWFNGRLMFFALLGLTQLTKGPMFGAVLVMAPVLGFLFSQPNRTSFLWLLNVPGILIFAVIACAWPFFIAQNHPEAITLWAQHTFGRLTEECVNPKPFWYYFSILPWQIFPWTLAVLPALPASIRRAWNEPRSLDRLFCLWFVLPLLLLSVPRGKHHHYLLHSLPPCSYWAALGLVWWARTVGQIWQRPLWRWSIVLGIVAASAGAASWAFLKMPRSVGIEFIIAGIALLVGTVLIMRHCASGRYRFAAGAMFVLLWGIHSYIHACWQHRTDGRYRESVLLKRVPLQVEENARVMIFAENPAISLYYSGRPVETALELSDARPRQDEPVYLLCQVTWEADLRRIYTLDRIDESSPPLAFPGQRATLALYRIHGPIHAHTASMKPNVADEVASRGPSTTP